MDLVGYSNFSVNYFDSEFEITETFLKQRIYTQVNKTDTLEYLHI